MFFSFFLFVTFVVLQSYLRWENFSRAKKYNNRHKTEAHTYLS